MKGVAWDSPHDVYAPRAAQAASDSELGDVIGAMLLELHDIHVNLAAGPQFYRYSGYDARPAFFDPGVVARYVTDRHAAPNAHSAFGHAAPDIGYVWILHFEGSGFGADIDTALAQLADVRALIIDVRDNPGGQRSNLEAVASRFTDRGRTYAFTRVRDGPRTRGRAGHGPASIEAIPARKPNPGPKAPRVGGRAKWPSHFGRDRCLCVCTGPRPEGFTQRCSPLLCPVIRRAAPPIGCTGLTNVSLCPPGKL